MDTTISLLSCSLKKISCYPSYKQISGDITLQVNLLLNITFLHSYYIFFNGQAKCAGLSDPITPTDTNMG